MIYLPSYDYVEFGEFVAVDRPINAIPTDILDDTLYISPANEYWIPLLIGALKVMLSARNWSAMPEEDLANMVGQIDDLVSNFKPVDHYLAVPTLNWRGAVNWEGAILGTDNQPANFLTYYNNLGFKTYTWSFIRGPANNEILAEVTFLDNNLAPCGIHIRLLDIVCSGFFGQVLITITDCADMPHAYIGAPSWHLSDVSPSGMNIKKITVATAEDMVEVCFVGDGLLVCGVA